MSKFLNALVGKLPRKLRPYAKALVPTLLAGALAVQDLTVSAVELNELRTLAIGAVTSLLVLAVPNAKKFNGQVNL